MVSACSDPSLSLCWYHSRTRTSASPELLPRQGKFCKELPIFFLIFSLLSGSTCACTTKTEEAAPGSKCPS